MKRPKALLLGALVIALGLVPSRAQARPNVVLMLADNVGIGEVGAYGSARGVPTPNIDRLGREGMRLTNFNVEYSCVPSRIALLTGRYAVRAGTNYNLGMTLWETTLAEALKSQGYATAHFGKWHLGGASPEGKREPIHQGFDEWYGITGTSHTSQFTSFPGFDPRAEPPPYVWEGKAGAASVKVKPFNLEARRTLDREAAERAVAFMQRHARSGTPFFVYYPITQIHFPSLPHPDKAGTTGAGDIGDAMADMDHNVGIVLTALERLGLEKDTLVIWCSDNGAEMRRPWRGSSGPWRGYYNSAMEGGIRTPCVIRWPGGIPAGRVSDEIVHVVDLFPTIAAAVGVPGIVPNDRAIDGVDQLPFLAGRQDRSNRDSAIFMARSGKVMAVKWRNWKFWYDFRTEMDDPEPNNLTRLFDLRVDPREETDVKDFYPWVVGITDRIVRDYEQSLRQYPRVERNAEDPYTPPAVGSGPEEKTYSRTDRPPLEKRGEALPKPDFSGTWSTMVLHTVSPIMRAEVPAVASLGSGWGDRISVNHSSDYLDVERTYFVPRDGLPTLRYRFALDGSHTENEIPTGRTESAPTSTATWDGDRLVLSTRYRVRDPVSKTTVNTQVTQTLWLQRPAAAPWEPTLVVETKRDGVLGGLPSINRTTYSRGYR